MVFPVVMYGCENWTIKKAECWRIGAFELWCWRRLLRVPWTARRSNQSILKEISPECSIGGTAAEAETPIFWPPDANWLIWDGWMASPTQWTWVWVSSQSWWWTGKPVMQQSMGSQESLTRLSDWIEVNWSARILTLWAFDYPLIVPYTKKT